MTENREYFDETGKWNKPESTDDETGRYSFQENVEQPHEDQVEINGKLYPKHAVDTARRIMEEDEDIADLEGMVRSVLVFEEAEKHAIHADPNEPMRAVVSASKHEKRKK